MNTTAIAVRTARYILLSILAGSHSPTVSLAASPQNRNLARIITPPRPGRSSVPNCKCCGAIGTGGRLSRQTLGRWTSIARILLAELSIGGMRTPKRLLNKALGFCPRRGLNLSGKTQIILKKSDLPSKSPTIFGTMPSWTASLSGEYKPESQHLPGNWCGPASKEYRMIDRTNTTKTKKPSNKTPTVF